MVRNEKMGKVFPKKFRRDFLGGVVYRGTCVGGLLGNKRPDRGKKKSIGGQKFSGGTFWGNDKKGVEKLFGGSKKWWEFFGGNFFGGDNNFLGENFSEKKKKIPGGILWKIFKKKFRGDFLGGSYTGGRVWGKCWEIKDKIGEKKISGGQKTFGGNAKKGWKNFFGGVLG